MGRRLVFVDLPGICAFTLRGLGAVVAEGMMRVVVVVFAALLTLGLAAFGVVAAQRANAPAAATAMVAQVAPPVRAHVRRRCARRSPILPKIKLAEAAKPAVATDAPAVAPIVLAQNTPAARRSSGTAERRSARAVSGEERSGLRQARRHGPRPHRRDRHHRRPRFRHRAFQAIRFPARQGSGADLRRRPVAGEHADGDQGAHRHVRQGDVLRDRRARHAGAPTSRRWWPRPA